MTAKDPAEIATELDLLLVELTKIRNDYPDAPGRDGFYRVLRKIQACLTSNGLLKEVNSFDPPGLAPTWGGPDRFKERSERYVINLADLIRSLREHPTSWIPMLEDGFARLETFYARRRVSTVGNREDYVSKDRIEELRSLPAKPWDVRRLVRLCEEINIVYSNDCLFSLAMLVRSVLDHVPPLFGEEKFEGVVARAKRSYKKAVSKLDAWRMVPDRALHLHMDRYSPVITPDEVDVSKELSVLIDEVIRRLKKVIA